MSGDLPLDLSVKRIEELNRLRRAELLAAAERARLLQHAHATERLARKRALATLAFVWLLILYLFSGRLA